MSREHRGGVLENLGALHRHAVKRSSAETSRGKRSRETSSVKRSRDEQVGDSSLAPHLVDLHVGAALRRGGAERGRGGDEAEQHVEEHSEEGSRSWMRSNALETRKQVALLGWSWRGGSVGQYTGTRRAFCDGEEETLPGQADGAVTELEN